MNNKVLKRIFIIFFCISIIGMMICDYCGMSVDFLYLSSALGFLWIVMLLYPGKVKVENDSVVEILNDYIIIEHIEVKASNTFHMTAQDQSKLVYKDALVKFTPKESRVKPGDTVIYNKAMAYPYLLDGKPHFIITEEYIVAIK